MIAFLTPGVSWTGPVYPHPGSPQVRHLHGRRPQAMRCIVFALLMLMFEFIKTTRQGKSFVEHFLALLLAGGATAEFVMVHEAANSTFFLLVVICFVDLFAGFAASLRRARRAVVIEPEPVVVAPSPRAEPVRRSSRSAWSRRGRSRCRQIRSPASSLRRRPSFRPAPSRW